MVPAVIFFRSTGFNCCLYGVMLQPDAQKISPSGTRGRMADASFGSARRSTPRSRRLSWLTYNI